MADMQMRLLRSTSYLSLNLLELETMLVLATNKERFDPEP